MTCDATGPKVAGQVCRGPICRGFGGVHSGDITPESLTMSPDTVSHPPSDSTGRHTAALSGG